MNKYIKIKKITKKNDIACGDKKKRKKTLMKYYK